MMRKIWEKRRGFTLVELLIVVAIIGILAGIAIPNFLGARTKAKISRSFADMRTMGNALELYYSAENYYPTRAKIKADKGIKVGDTFYLAGTPKDPFADTRDADTSGGAIGNDDTYGYFTNTTSDTSGDTTSTMWLIVGNGPDKTVDVTGIVKADFTGDPGPVSGEIGGTNGADSGYGINTTNAPGGWWVGPGLGEEGDIGRAGP